jgi:hypothetical protein
MMMRDSSHENVEVCSEIHRDTLHCREKTYLVEQGDSSPLQQYIVLGDHLHSGNNYRSDDGGRVIEHQFMELLTGVPDGWILVMSIGDYSPWVPVDELLVKYMGLTNAYDTSQAYK